MKNKVIDTRYKGSLLISTTPVPYRIPGKHTTNGRAVPGLPIPEAATWGSSCEKMYKVVDIKSAEATEAIAAEIAYKKENPKYVTTAERFALCTLKNKRAIYPQVLRKVTEETGDSNDNGVDTTKTTDDKPTGPNKSDKDKGGRQRTRNEDE